MTCRIGSRVLALAAVALCLSACSNSNLAPTTVIIPAPAITCPAAPAAVIATNGTSASVTYAAATVTGGTTPVAVTCTPQSGSAFPLGTTAVSCTAKDAVGRTSACSFPVTVTLPPLRLKGVSTILAFGDSITEGEVPDPGEFPGVSEQFVHVEDAYPAALTRILAQQYPTQGPVRLDAFCGSIPARPTADLVVVNGGCLGAKATDPATRSYLDDKIARYNPEVVLLLIGVNDLNQGVPVDTVVQAVLALISAARRNGAAVLVGTLLPQSSGVNAVAPTLVPAFNARLAPAAAAMRATVVDLYSDIYRDVPDWIGYDGLHPTAAGYQEIASKWFSVIQQLFETRAALTSVTTSGGALSSRTRISSTANATP